MKAPECIELIIDNLNHIKTESIDYYNKIVEELKSFNESRNYSCINDFYADYLQASHRHYFTITSHDSFSKFETETPGHAFLYSPLNDHSRPYMHKGDVVFCYRQGQFTSLNEALDQRGIYGIGFVISDPQIIYPEKQKHEKWGVAISLPVIFPNHLELRNIQLHPSTINLTPYNGNRNDALQHIDKSEHYNTLLSLLVGRNPGIKNQLESLLGTSIEDIVLPDYIWADSIKINRDNNRESVKEEFKYYLINIARSGRRTEDGFNLKPASITSYLAYLEPEKLFDYNPSKWLHIKSLYDITSPSVLDAIYRQLFDDTAFVNHDKTDAQGWRSGALMHYISFIRARAYFSKLVVTKSDTVTVKNEKICNLSLPLQVIYFGAPGTSKSTHIKNLIGNIEQHRVTFHPDFDYASFVGCYKPTTNNKHPLYSASELKRMFTKQAPTLIRPEYRFAAKYFESFAVLGKEDVKNVYSEISSASIIDAEIPKILAFIEELKNSHIRDFNSITYEFVAQPFIKAYVSAWKKLCDSNENQKEVFLIIEEINRGNCAQIFGDLFQLLDRNNDGYSDYSIEPDTDLSEYLAKEFADSSINNDNIKSGKTMMLPPNLYIWATMNTSDQSLFPIDSAFKRRWEWKYTPIKKDTEHNHVIRLSKSQYDWWQFVKNVNERIENVTESEDKQIGYWFAKPDDGNAISAERFVSKVVFYLWNDVFKDYGHDINSPFIIKIDDKNKKELRFKSFFTEDGDIDETVLIEFMSGLSVDSTDIPDGLGVTTESTMPETPDLMDVTGTPIDKEQVDVHIEDSSIEIAETESVIPYNEESEEDFTTVTRLNDLIKRN